MPVLAETYAVSNVDIPLTRRVIGQTWTVTGGSNRTINNIDVYLGKDVTYVDRLAVKPIYYFRKRTFFSDNTQSSYKTLTNAFAVKTYTGTSDDLVLPAGSTFAFDLTLYNSGGGPASLIVEVSVGAETLTKTFAIPAFVAGTETLWSFQLDTFLVAQQTNIVVRMKTNAGTLIIADTLVYPVYPLDVEFEMSIHEILADGSPNPTPIDNGINTNTVTSVGLTGVPAAKTFTFGNSPYVENGKTYGFMLTYKDFYYETDPPNNSTAIVAADNAGLGYANGHGLIYYQGEWGDDAVYGETDLKFDLYYADVTVEPTPTAVSWSADCDSQISQMSALLTAFQTKINTISNDANSIFQVDLNEAPTQTAWEAAWVREGYTLPLDTDRRFIWKDTVSGGFGGLYVPDYDGETLVPISQYYMRGQTQLFGVANDFSDSKLAEATNFVTTGAGVSSGQAHVYNFTTTKKAWIIIHLLAHAWIDGGGAVTTTFEINYALDDWRGSLEYSALDTAMLIYTPKTWSASTVKGEMMFHFKYLHPTEVLPGNHELLIKINLNAIIVGNPIYTIEGGTKIPTYRPDVTPVDLPPPNIKTISHEVIDIWQLQP